MPLRALARVNLAAIERNVARLRAVDGDRTRLCVVVKADAYGHGAVPVACAAKAAGAAGLAVATAAEAAALRAAGIDGTIVVLGALSADELPLALDARAEIVVWRETFAAALAAEATRRGQRVPLHVKLDTGMGRLGTRDAAEATRVAELAASHAHLRLAALMTHFATADEPGDAFFDAQLERFRAWAEPLRERHPGVLLHAANSAAFLREPAARFDIARPGVAVYGLDPFGADPAAHGLEPALELVSYVAEVKPCAAGESAGYGRRFIADRDTVLATIPVGYGDGWRRALTNDCDVLVDGRRYPLVGTVSMDNVTLDLGSTGDGVVRGAEAVLLGARGGERILAEEVARRLGTINYEVVCGLLPRVPRAYHRDGEPA
jgi:alanine racemase